MSSKTMKSWLNQAQIILTKDSFLITILTLYALIVFLGEQFTDGITSYLLWIWADFSCTLVFLLEMIVKIRQEGWKDYFKNNWFDAFVIILSLPSLLIPFIDIRGFHVVAILRLLRISRVMRVFLLFHYLPNVNKLLHGLWVGIRQTATVLVGFFIVMFVFALISYALFKDFSFELFGTPLRSLYSMFQLFTIEGWYDIPNALAEGTTSGWADFIRIYFVVLVALLGIIGMAFITSIFVDAMGEKDSEDLQKQIQNMSQQIEILIEQQKELAERLEERQK